MPLPERRSLGHSVYENLKEAIIEGSLAPGRRVVETRFAEALGISRTPVREAMHKLEREGLLRQDPKGGFYVVGLTRSDLEEAFGIGTVLEGYAARLAAIRYREGELAPLEKKLADYETCLNQGRIDELTGIDRDFHELLYGLSRSPKLAKMIDHIREQIFRFKREPPEIGGVVRAGNEDHRLIMAAIRAREADRAEHLVRKHLESRPSASLTAAATPFTLGQDNPRPVDRFGRSPISRTVEG